jgi:hypothetical protein
MFICTTWMPCASALELLHQQRDARILHDDHIRLFVDQGSQGLLHCRRIERRIADDEFHAAPLRLGLDHPTPFVHQRHAGGDRQEGDGLAFEVLVVIGAQFVRGLRPAFLLREGAALRARQHERRHGRRNSRPHVTSAHDRTPPW